MNWDIFCSVVDNYGDIGVTWRLARQLVAEHGLQVRLWVDEPAAFARLCPDADAAADCQLRQGVEVRRWATEWQPVEPADAVIEAFACQLPATYIDAMAARDRAPLWLNLEYLSAEDWVGSFHGLPSPQAGGLQKFFFFPGFSEGTGGLLRERGLLERRDTLRSDAAAQADFLRTLGVERVVGARLISLFAYENAALPGWLDVLAAASRPTQLLVPEGRVLGDVARWLGVDSLAVGAKGLRGNLSVQVLPFMPQDDYDRLLWCCDFNAVRGEDSFVRAQWAGRPLLWHIYQQEEDVHLEKLEAFLALYVAGLDDAPAQALLAAWRAWNQGGDMGAAWLALQPFEAQLQAHTEQWCGLQAGRRDLAAGLVHFYTNWI
ncbi:elongation factor P maturation arginine rhamnosyltransferase EarP [Pseudomonas sp. PDM13]|uniref:elongation factor P maturation arginine rhamnosyltransferase EarP n=1 Tax=Pseudomonas sp. PDM13 TaxID=2769255 RepID=UPI0021DFD34A|nr:elongation factor P maturation arginine rhamnosyltransferase EarP [Pseudomonas sp. PDM13]MCU9949796.1 elongation factor P maturation arginine rhamnosyltransferase EarP [Pseudomonas sp. PDM13]